MCVYIYIYMCIYIYIYIYIYVLLIYLFATQGPEDERSSAGRELSSERVLGALSDWQPVPVSGSRKGQMGSALMGSLQMLCFLTEGLFGYSRWSTFISPEVAGHTFFANLSKFITFAAAPLVLTPCVRNQGSLDVRGEGQARSDRRGMHNYGIVCYRVCIIYIYIYIYMIHTL